MKPYTAHADTVQQELAQLARAEEERLATALGDLRRDTAAAHADLQRLRTEVRAPSEDDTGERLDNLADAIEEMRAAKTARIDDLVGQVDELRAVVDSQQHLLSSLGLAPPRGDGSAFEDLPAAPAEPWSEEYNKAHRELVARVLDDPAASALIGGGEELPAGYGTGFDERVVEFPWIAAQHLSGVVLDAGSTLNHLHVLKRLRPRVDALDIVTLAPEEQSFPQLGVSYLYADLRALPLLDERYERIVSISTLEHVGLDNAHFGADAPAGEDPQREAVTAVRELHRVLRPGGDLYLTVPVGTGERYPWVRSLTHEELDELIAAFGPAEATVTHFRHTPSGWTRSDREGTADARYRDHLSSGPPGEDRIVAAEAVACVHLVR